MKHLIRVVLALLLTAGVSYAGAIADNDQFQSQYDGGGAIAFPGFDGFIGGAGGEQTAYGFATSSFGDYAMETQINFQSETDSVYDSDGIGDFGGSAWNEQQYQEETAEASGGFAASQQYQEIVGGAAGVSVLGMDGVAGSYAHGYEEAATEAVGFAYAENAQYEEFQGFYEQQSIGFNGGYVHQTGTQDIVLSTETSAAFAGIGYAEAGVDQFGGSEVHNNGVGTSMEGHATAAGEAYANTGDVGFADASASAYGVQVHVYEQANFSPDGSSFQFQTGTVMTEVQASSN